MKNREKIGDKHMRTGFRFKEHIVGRGSVVLVIAILMITTAMSTAITSSFKTDSSIGDNENIRITLQNNEDVLTINYQISEFASEEVTIDGNKYFRISLDDESNIMFKGKPELPNICRSILIPDDLKMEVIVTQSQYQEYEGIRIIPSKGHLLRTVNPDDVLYEFDQIYNENKWFPEKIVELREPYILRDFRGQVVEINPFQYNPVEEKLRFYMDITIDIYPNGFDLINCINRKDLPSKIDTDFMQIYENHFINLNIIFNRYAPVEEQGNMLVITYDNFWDSMMPFVQWKNMRGIPTEMVNVSSIGGIDAIKTYISDYYYTNNLTFVLLVGDADQVPTYTDPRYSYIVGSDHYPDLFVGRFSAETISEVETQVNRSIEYEKLPQENGEWYHNGTGIASNQGPGDDGEKDWEHMRNIRTCLIDYHYTYVDELYDSTHGGGDKPGNPSSSMVSITVNNGTGVINFCGHGDTTSWGTTGFNNDNVNALTNDNMLPFIISVACYNGQFFSTTCFAEAWMRATHDNESTGAIGAFMSSKAQSWNPPMDAQDEIVDLMVESYDDNKKNTYGGICFNGCMHMNDEYGSEGYSETDAWHVFGDPSLQVRTDMPSSMDVIHNPEIDEESTTFDVTVPDLEDALCAISRNYILLGYGYTDETGHTTIEFDEPIMGEEPLDIVVTAYNKIPYIACIIVDVNDPPEIPCKPSGKTRGEPSHQYLYTTNTTDLDDNRVLYNFSWGDGNYSDWIGPYDSGDTASARYTWNEKGTYEIKVKARDTLGEESKWSEPLEVSMPKDQSYGLFFDILQKYFPRLYVIVWNIIDNIKIVER